MESYNDQYYIVLNDYHEDTLYVGAKQKSADRRFGYKKLILGQEPLFFENDYKEEDIKVGKERSIPSVLIDASTPIVNSRIRDKLKFFDFVGMQLYPSVYIDDNGKYHENYWCMNFWEKLDCWDREKSVTEEFDDEDMLEPDYLDDADIYKYYLDPKVLDKIPEEDRLIFKMSGGSMGYVFIHQKIADIFKAENATGVKLIKVADFEEGMQF